MSDTQTLVDQMWDYISSHQGETFKNIALEWDITEELAKQLAFDWAFGDKERFEKRLKENRKIK